MIIKIINCQKVKKTLIKDKEYHYTVINRRQTEKEYEKDFVAIKTYVESRQGRIPEGWILADREGTVFVKRVSHDEYSHVLAVSQGRTEKEQGMDALKEKRFLEDIGRLKKSFEKGNILLPAKIGERVGKIKAKYPTMGKYYDIDLKFPMTVKKLRK